MKVKFKKLSNTAVTPSYSREGDAGLDLVADKIEYSSALGMHIISTGIGIELPEGTVGLVYPRSSISKTNHRLTNCVGVIDSNYRGDIMLKFDSSNNHQNNYKVGDRVAQLIVQEIPNIELVEVEELGDSVRGSNGFGSSGK